MAEPTCAVLVEQAGETAASPGAVRVARLISVRHGVIALIALALVGLLALLGITMARRQGQSGPFAGFGVNTVGKAAQVLVRPAPDFTLQLFDGTTFRLSEQRGRVVVVNYWASWCPPCRQEAPALEAAWKAWRERGVLFVGLNVWDTEGNAQAFLRDFGISYPNGPDRGGRILIEYGVTGIPETFFIDREGILFRRWIGPLNERQMQALIEELLE